MTAKINYKLVVKTLGILLLLEGFFMLACLPFSIYYQKPTLNQVMLFTNGHDFWPLLISGLIAIFIGALVYFTFKDISSRAGKREGFIIVSFSWVIISIFGALPFYFGDDFTNYTDAFFETMSGFTTTGASIFSDIEAIPHGILFWRALTHWIGGMGIIVFTLAILPIFGIGGISLFAAEVPGPTPDKLHPKITSTAKLLWGIYVLLTFIETIFLMLGGMDLFDGLSHAFATMATGGFSTKNTSAAEFSPYIQYVITIFMVLAGTNFTLHYLALNGKLKDVFKNEEYRWYMGVIIGATVIISVYLTFVSGMHWEKAFRDSAFQIASIITTTGFVSADYLQWPVSMWMILFFLMFVGGSAGSTGGGMKVMRILLIVKNSFLELKRLIHPNAIIPLRFNKRSVDQITTYNILSFFVIYLFTFFFGTFFMSSIGMDFDTSVGATIACLGNIGPGIGNVGPVDNYAAIPIVGKWFLSFLMMLGRLELFTVLILFSPSFWKG